MTAATDPRETTLRRLSMRSIRRGIREMDLILGGYAESRLAELDAQELAAYEALLHENDQDLYRWVSGQAAPPPEHEALIADIVAVTAHRSEVGKTDRA